MVRSGVERIGLGEWSLQVPEGWSAEEEDDGIVLERDDENDEGDFFILGDTLAEPVSDETLRELASEWLEAGYPESWVDFGVFDGLSFVVVDPEDDERSHLWYLRSGPVSIYVCYRCESDVAPPDVINILESLTRSVSPGTFHLVEKLTENHERFVRCAVEGGNVWMLARESTLFTCASNETDSGVLLVWSDRTYAQRALQAVEALGFQVTCSSLADFIDHDLAEFAEAGLLIGPNYTADLAGVEVDPEELRAQLVALRQTWRER